MKKILLLLTILFASSCDVVFAQDIPFSRDIDMKNNDIKNVGLINGIDLDTIGTKSIVDSIKARTLDPYVFASLYPTVGEFIGPIYITMDLEITASYGFLSGDAGESIKFNVFWADAVNIDAVSGQHPDVSLYYYDAPLTPNTGAEITYDTYSVLPDKGKWIWCIISEVVGTPTNFSVSLVKRER